MQSEVGARTLMKRPTLKTHPNGTKEWSIGGRLHREDGPAIEYSNGAKAWYLHEECHREDGPAVEYASGDKEWFLNGKLHREDGPAVERADGTKRWYLNDKRFSKGEWFEQLTEEQQERVLFNSEVMV